jgi:hypothetical protein
VLVHCFYGLMRVPDVIGLMLVPGCQWADAGEMDFRGLVVVHDMSGLKLAVDWVMPVNRLLGPGAGV